MQNLICNSILLNLFFKIYLNNGIGMEISHNLSMMQVKVLKFMSHDYKHSLDVSIVIVTLYAYYNTGSVVKHLPFWFVSNRHRSLIFYSLR